MPTADTSEKGLESLIAETERQTKHISDPETQPNDELELVGEEEA